MAKCLACLSPKRRQIDKALAAGESIRITASRFGLDRNVIQRHRAHLVEAVEAVPPGTHPVELVPVGPLSFIGTLRRILTDMQRIAAAAESDESWAAAVAANREQTRVLELVVRAQEAQDARDKANGAGEEFDLSRLTVEEIGQLRAIRLKLSGAPPALVAHTNQEEPHGQRGDDSGEGGAGVVPRA